MQILRHNDYSTQTETLTKGKKEDQFLYIRKVPSIKKWTCSIFMCSKCENWLF